MKRRLDTLTVVACFLLAISPRVNEAQDVFGTVRDSITGANVRGAVVMVLAPNREPIARGLSSSNGAFRLSIGSGTIVRVIRIGFLPFERPINQLASPLVINLEPAGRMIERVAIRSNPVCPRRSDQRQALSLWSSATDALLAMVVATADSQHSGLMTLILYDRLMYPDGTTIRRQSTRRTVTGNVLPIRADRDPDEFVRVGYAVTRATGTTWYAPDPEVLLDSSFAATHCLSMRGAPRGDTTRIGVAFAPPSDRGSFPDIEGVLWLNRNPLSLHSLEFEYRGVPLAVMNMRAGGRLEFETLADGVPIISSWKVRSPRLAYVRTGRAVVAEIHENGGLIADGVHTDGTSWTAPLATVRGTISNIVSRQPVNGATVTLDSTDQKTVTDSSGRFLFGELLPGPYVLRVIDSMPVHPMRVDSSGELVTDTTTIMQLVTRTATVDLNVQLGYTPLVETHLPWREPFIGCGNLSDPRRFTVTVEVFTTDIIPVPNVPVRLSWADTSRNVVLETTVDASTRADGLLVVCGIPSDRTLGTRVVGPNGIVHTGTSRITREQPDVKKSQQAASLRAITIKIPKS